MGADQGTDLSSWELQSSDGHLRRSMLLAAGHLLQQRPQLEYLLLKSARLASISARWCLYLSKCQEETLPSCLLQDCVPSFVEPLPGRCRWPVVLSSFQWRLWVVP